MHCAIISSCAQSNVDKSLIKLWPYLEIHSLGNENFETYNLNNHFENITWWQSDLQQRFHGSRKSSWSALRLEPAISRLTSANCSWIAAAFDHPLAHHGRAFQVNSIETDLSSYPERPQGSVRVCTSRESKLSRFTYNPVQPGLPDIYLVRFPPWETALPCAKEIIVSDLWHVRLVIGLCLITEINAQ